MNGEGKNTTTSEAPNDAADDVAVDDAFGGNGSHGDDGSDDPVAPFDENEHTQLQIEENEEPHVENSEGEEEEEEEEEEDEEDEDAMVEEKPGPVFGDSHYVVEAIRRKRVLKRQVQYLVKWLGWPETDNTWEPVENLENVGDIIDDFEKSLSSGKQRKRKREHVAHHTQIKKRLERSATPYSLRRFPARTAGNHTQSARTADNHTQSARTADNHTQSAPLNDLSFTDPPAFPNTVLFADELESNGDDSSMEKATFANGSGSSNASELVERNEESDYDPKLSELKAAATANGYGGADKLAVQFEEAKDATDNHHMDVQLEGGCTEPVQNGHCRVTKRRKSGSLERFKKASYAGVTFNTPNPIGIPVDAFESPRTGSTDHVGNIKPVCNIVKIIKPVGYSPVVASDIQDVVVTFMAMRSDGTEVMVDNKYLKSFNPVLLIDFYEQHLRYGPD